MKRGDVYLTRIDPCEGSEQAGTRPAVIVSRDAINRSSPVVIVVPCTTWRAGRKVYPSQILLRPPDGGLSTDTLALGEQIRAIARDRLITRWGVLAPQTMAQLDRALSIALDLPGQFE